MEFGVWVKTQVMINEMVSQGESGGLQADQMSGAKEAATSVIQSFREPPTIRRHMDWVREIITFSMER